MSNCITVFGERDKEKSLLRKNLASPDFLGKERGYALYDELVNGHRSGSENFTDWIDNKIAIHGIDSVLRDENGEVAVTEVQEWLEHIKKHNTINRKFTTNSFMSTTKEFMNLVEGMNYFVAQQLRENGLPPTAYENSSLANITNVYNQAYESLKQRVFDVIEEKEYADVKDRMLLIWDELEKNKSIFMDAYNEYSKINTGIDLEGIGILDEYMESLEEAETKDAAFDKNANETDVKKDASPSLKFAFSIIPKLDKEDNNYFNHNGLPQVENYTNIFNRIHQELEPLEADIDIYLSKLEEMKEIYPGLQTLIDMLNNSSGTYKFSSNARFNALTQQFRTQFVNQFNKTRSQFLVFLVEDGEKNAFKVVEGMRDTAANRKMSEWENEFRKRLSEKTTTYRKFADAPGNLSAPEKLELLGIPSDFISEEDLEDIDAIYHYGKGSESLFDELYRPKRGEGVKQRIKSIAERYVDKSAEVVDFQTYNSEGKLVYGISLNSFLSSRVKEMKIASNDIELWQRLDDKYSNGFSKNSQIMEWLGQSAVGEQDFNLIFGNYDGVQADGEGQGAKNLVKKDVALQRVRGVLAENKYPFIRSADRGIENFIGTGRKFVENRSNAVKYLKEHFLAEKDAMSRNRDVVFYNENNKDFRVFYVKEIVKGEVRNKSLLEAIHPPLRKARLDKNKEKTEQALKDAYKKLQDTSRSSDVVDDFINQMLDQVVQQEGDSLRELDSYTNIHKSQLFGDLQYETEEELVEDFAFNTYIANIEFFKLFIGDPAYYKSPADIFKRTSMLNSTKESARVDKEMNNYIKSLPKRFEEQARGEEYSDTRPENSSIKTITLEDVVSDSTSYSKEFNKLLRKYFPNEYDKYAKIYDSMNEADAQAFMTYDEYRIANIRFGTWYGKDEILYTKIANGDMTVADEIMRRATVKKFQYSGELIEGNDEFIPAGRKFSVIPLIPNVLEEGSTLSKLNEVMLKEEIGMAFFTSAAKFGYKTDETGEANKLYDENGKYAFNPDMIDTLDYMYMGDQVKIHNKDKSETTASSQKRKIQMADFFSGGIIASDYFVKKLKERGFKDAEAFVEKELKPAEEGEPKTFHDLLNDYNDLQGRIVRDKFRETFGFDISTAIEDANDTSSLIKILKAQGLKMGYSTNELQGLNILDNHKIIDILPNKQKVESLITAVLRNNVINHKRTGTSLAQVSDVGFEITEEVRKQSERHNLKFYRENENGRLLPMEIMLPLPQELVGYVRSKYGNGQLTKEALNRFNKDLEKANELYEKDDKSNSFYNLLNDITTYVGFRIPNQAASSSDVAKVKKFMYPSMGGTIVVPKPIVAKTGSDFDIDKLNLYKPKLDYIIKDDIDIAEETVDEYMRDEDGNLQYQRMVIELENHGYEVNKQRLVKDFAKKVLSKPRKMSDSPYLTSMKELYAFNVQTKPIIAITYDHQSVDNQLLETEIGLTLHEFNKDNLLRPLANSIIAGVVEKIRSLTGRNSDLDHISDVVKNWKNVDKYNAFLSGKAGVGQVAVHITNHILAQKAGLKMKRMHDFFTPKSKRNNEWNSEWRDLGLIENEDGDLISEVLSELLTAYVDIAKDPYILDINAISTTANTILMMTRWGISPTKTFLFMNQPIIKRFVELEQQNKALTTMQDEYLYETDLVSTVLKEFGLGRVTDKMIYFRQKEDPSRAVSTQLYDDSPFTNQQLENQIKGTTNNKTMHLKVLDTFLEYRRQSNYLQEMRRATSPDTQNFKNITSIESQVALREKVESQEMFQNVDKMFDESFIGEYQDAKERYFDYVKDLFLAQNPFYKEKLDRLKTIATHNVFDSNQQERIVNMIEGDFIVYLLTKKGFIRNGDFVDLFESSSSIPKVIDAMKKYRDPDTGELVFANHEFLNIIQPLINDRKQGYDSMKVFVRRMTSFQREQVSESIRELKKEEAWIEQTFGMPNFFENLVVYQLIQSGLTNSPFSFHNSIPVGEFSETIRNYIEEARSSMEDISDFTDMDGVTLEGEERVAKQRNFTQWSQFFFNHLNIFTKNISSLLGRGTKVMKSGNKMLVKRGPLIYEGTGQPPRYIQYGKAPEQWRGSNTGRTAESGGFVPPNAKQLEIEFPPVEQDKINPALEKTLTSMLNSLGVDVNYINNIRKADGTEIGPVGRAKLFEGVVEVSRNRRNVTTLPEEASHMIMGLLGKNHALVKMMMKTATKFPEYDTVREQYYGVPGYTTEEDFQFEAAGKLLAKFIIMEATGNGKQEVENWWQRVKRVLRLFLNKVQLKELKDELTVFEDLAKQIVSQKLREQDFLQAEVTRRKRLNSILRSYNLNMSGFFPSSIDPEALRTDLNKAGLLGMFQVKESRVGSYYLTKNGRKWDPNKEIYYQLEPITQDDIDKKFKEHDNKKSPNMHKSKDEYGLDKERYIFEGEVIEGRISALQDALFREGKLREQIIEIQTSAKSQFAKAVGTEAHALNELIMTNAIYGTPRLISGNNAPNVESLPETKYLQKNQVGQLINSVQELADHISETQKKIDPDGKAKVYTERFVVDEKRDIAGTADVVVVYSDGSASVYDYKFINFHKSNVRGVWKVDPKSGVPFVKENSYSLQIGEYKRILKEVYGIRHFRDTRILPNNVQYNYDENGDPTSVRSLEGTSKKSTKKYLKPLPVIKELTDDKKLNNILTTLFRKQETLSLRIRKNWGNDELVDMLELERQATKDAIQNIQLERNLTPLINTMNTVISHTFDIASDIDMESIDDLVKMMKEIEGFENIYNTLSSEKLLLKEKDKKGLDELTSNITRARATLKDKLEELMIEFIGEEVTDPQRELNAYKRNMAYMSKIDQPVFTKAWEMIKTANTRIFKQSVDFAENLKKEKVKLEKWAKGSGISLMDAYRMLINPETGNLKPMFKTSFFQERKKAYQTKDPQWFKDNYKLSEEGKKRYAKALENYKKYLKRTVGLDTNMGSYRLDLWKAKNDLENQDSAWLNKKTINRFAEIKEPEKHYSEEYKKIRNKKPLHDYYMFYRDANVMFNTIDGIDEYIPANFVANVRKDIVDTLAQDKNLFKAAKNFTSDFTQGLRVRQNDIIKTPEDDSIPLMYFDNFLYKKKDGSWDKGLDKKNEDLTQNLMLFAEAVYRKQEMSSIKDTVDAMKMFLGTQDVIKLKRGKPILEDGQIKTDSSTKNMEVFDKMTKGLVYGKRLQNDDFTYAIGDKEYSGTKTINALMKFLSIKALSFNYVSGFGNLAAGYANTYIKGVGGRYYTNKQMWRAHKLLMSRGNGDIFNHLANYFNVEKDYWAKELAGDLSASKLTKNLREDHFFLLQQRGDEFIGNTVLVAMMQNYGMDENGNIKRLELLPKETKSLLERTSVVNDKIEIEGLTEEGFTKFRGMVRYVSRQVKGTTTREDIFIAQTNVWSRMFLHFRSWISPMYEERFGSMKYTKEVEEWEVGRYQSFAKQIMNRKFIPNVVKVMADVITLGAFKVKGDSVQIEKDYNDFLAKNPDIDPATFGLNEYYELRMRKMREMIVEIRMLSAIFLLNIMAWSDWDEDNTPNYKESKATREGYKLFRRGWLELTFFLNPASTQELLRKPIPILSLLTDLVGFGSNTFDEVTDTILGENNPRDRTGWGHYVKKTIPIGNQVLRFMEDIDVTQDDDSFTISPLKRILEKK